MIDREAREKMLEHLRANSIVSYACKKSGVSRATFYRWLKEDDGFADDVREATVLGRASICDMAESVVLSALNASDVGAAKFVLTRCHPEYQPRKPKPTDLITFEPIKNIFIDTICNRCRKVHGECCPDQ